MKYNLVSTRLFFSQVKKLSHKSKGILKQKLLLVRENPFRNKRIGGYSLFLFRIRLQDKGKSLRVVYLVDGLTIKILCILSRKKNYSDLRVYLKKLDYL